MTINHAHFSSCSPHSFLSASLRENACEPETGRHPCKSQQSNVSKGLHTHKSLTHTHRVLRTTCINKHKLETNNRTLTRPQTQICRGAHRSRRALLVSEPLLWTAARSPHTEHRQREREREKEGERERERKSTHQLKVAIPQSDSSGWTCSSCSEACLRSSLRSSAS